MIYYTHLGKKGPSPALFFPLESAAKFIGMASIGVSSPVSNPSPRRRRRWRRRSGRFSSPCSSQRPWRSRRFLSCSPASLRTGQSAWLNRGRAGIDYWVKPNRVRNRFNRPVGPISKVMVKLIKNHSNTHRILNA